MGEPSSLTDERDANARFLADLTTEALVRRDDKDEYVPRLAEQVPSTENGLVRLAADERSPSGRLVVTFVLRPGLVWQDGQPLTSDDVRFAWEHDRRVAHGERSRADAALVERIDTPDARTAVLYLTPGTRTARYPLLARALPRHVLERSEAEPAYARRPVHAGPFLVASWQEGYGATLTPFRRFALGAPGLTRIEVRFLGDRDALVEALARGDLDMAPASSLGADLAPRLERFAESRGLLPRYTPQQSAEFLLFNLRRPPFSDVRVRRAVALGVDRKAIVKELFTGRARIPSSYLFAPSWAAAEVPSLPDTDPPAARALLGAAGYCASTRCVGVPMLHARLLVESGSPPRLAAAELVARDLATIGFIPTVISYGPGAIERALAQGEFDLAVVGRGADDPADATAEYTRGPDNPTGYTNGWFDILAGAAANALTRAERRPLYAELQRLWSADLPALPLYQHLAVDVVPAALDGVAPTAHGEPISWSAGAWRFVTR